MLDGHNLSRVPVTIIAEAGVNHCGSLDRALKLVDAAKAAGADIVKFQTFTADKLVHRKDRRYDVLRELELDRASFRRLALHCLDVGIEFLSTPGDVDSLQFLIKELTVRRIKIGSDDLTYEPLVNAAFASRLPVILSTGLATMNEIRNAMRYATDNVALLHCVSAYPCSFADVNLRSISYLSSYFNVPVGYSDHTGKPLASIVAAAMGAAILEVHFKVDPYDEVPDEVVSMSSHELAALVTAVRDIEQLRGQFRKEPCSAELVNVRAFRKAEDGLRCVC